MVKWWLISDEDVDKIKKGLEEAIRFIPQFGRYSLKPFEDALHTLETGLHETYDLVPVEPKKFEVELVEELRIESAYDYFENEKEDWVTKEINSGVADSDLIREDLPNRYPDTKNFLEYVDDRNMGYFILRRYKAVKKTTEEKPVETPLPADDQHLNDNYNVGLMELIDEEKEKYDKAIKELTPKEEKRK